MTNYIGLSESARVAEQADALDLGSSGQPWGFKSPLSHYQVGEMELKINVSDISPIRKKVEVEIPAERVTEEIDAFLRRLNREVRVKGFRPGKVPLGILKTRYRDYLEEKVSLKLIDDTYQKIVEERELRPVATPQIDREGIVEGEAFKYSAVVEVRPQLEVTGYTGLRLKKREARVTPEMVEERLKALQEEQAKARAPEEDRGAGDDDLLVVDIKGEVVGEARSRFQKNGLTFLMSSSPFPAGFAERLKGARVGEAREFTLSYPDGHRDRSLAGRQAQFLVTVKEIKEVVRPALDDELAKELGCQTLEELREQVRTNLQEEEERRVVAALKEEAKELLLARNSLEVPPSMVDLQVEARIDEIRATLRKDESEPDWVQLSEELKAPVEREIKANLILEEIGKSEGIEVTGDKLDQEFQRIASLTRRSPEEVKKIYTREELMESLRRRLLIGDALDLVLSRAELVEDEDVNPHGS